MAKISPGLALFKKMKLHQALSYITLWTLISIHWIGNDRFDCEVTRPPSFRAGCTQKDRYTQHERII